MATIDLGKIKQVFRGTYDNSTAYVPDDLVVFTDGSVTSTYICTTATTGNNPSSGGTAHGSWAYVAKGQATSPTTTRGDVIVRGVSADERLAIGTAGQVLKVNSGANGLEYGAGGGVVQTKSTHKADTFTTTATSYTDITGLNVDITPTSSSNKILVLVNITFGGNTNLYAFGRLVRTTSGSSSVAIGMGNASSNSTQAGFPFHNLDVGNAVYHIKESSFMFLDSPNTTTSTNYKIQCFTHSSGSSLFINRPQNDDNSNYIGRFSSNIIAMEVTP